MIDTTAGVFVLAEVLQGLAFLDVLGPTDMPPIKELVTVHAIDYHGSRNGTIVIGLSNGLAESIAATLIDEIGNSNINEEMIDSAMGELTNVVAGNFAPLLDTTGGEIRLGSPRKENFPENLLQHHHLALSTSEGTIGLVIVERAEN